MAAALSRLIYCCHRKGGSIMPLLEVNQLKKVYTTRFGGNQINALNGVSFTVEKEEYVAIMGESGSGKTTLLNILAALDKPTGGAVLLNGISGFQSSGYIFSGGQYLSAHGSGKEELRGNETEGGPHRGKAGD